MPPVAQAQGGSSLREERPRINVTQDEFVPSLSWQTIDCHYKLRTKKKSMALVPTHRSPPITMLCCDEADAAAPFFPTCSVESICHKWTQIRGQIEVQIPHILDGVGTGNAARCDAPSSSSKKNSSAPSVVNAGAEQFRSTPGRRKTPPWFSVPCVCPEPVLANDSFL